MADGNYDEVTNTIYQGESRENIDPMFHWDLHFPERISRLRISPEFSSPVSRRPRRTRDRCAVRYKTQPITFDEITEVDEDPSGQHAAAAQTEDQEVTAEMKVNFKNTMTGFSRSMDGLVTGSGPKKGGSGSDKENTPFDGDRLTNLDPAVAEGQQRPETGSSQTKPTSAADSFGSVGRSADGVQHRRKRLNRKHNNRNTVEEVPETETKVEEPEKV